jgi:hypothetical protein
VSTVTGLRFTPIHQHVPSKLSTEVWNARERTTRYLVPKKNSRHYVRVHGRKHHTIALFPLRGWCQGSLPLAIQESFGYHSFDAYRKIQLYCLLFHRHNPLVSSIAPSSRPQIRLLQYWKERDERFDRKDDVVTIRSYGSAQLLFPRCRIPSARVGEPRR